jgi:D-3-phosphoglycerate dehydrogenase
MFNMDILDFLKPGIKIVNVGRGPLIQQDALIEGMRRNLISSAALDVFEVEPFNTTEHLKLLELEDRLIVGSHNGSNTREAVEYVSRLCITKLNKFLNDWEPNS